MFRIATLVAVLAWSVLLPIAAYAQASVGEYLCVPSDEEVFR